MLLAIAGAVAAVLLTRAGEETDRLEEETDRWSDIGSFTGCKIGGGEPQKANNSVAATVTDFDHCAPPS